MEGIDENTFVAAGGDLGRYLLVRGSDPLDAQAVDAMRTLQDRAPDLVREVDLDGAVLLLGGDTAISATLVERTLAATTGGPRLAGTATAATS